MNIESTHRGVIHEVLNTDRPKLEVELPVLFTKIATGPTGIAEALVTNISVSNIEFHAADLTIFSLAVKIEDNGGFATIAGEAIKRRPIKFQPDGRGNNPLVLAFSAYPREKPDSLEIIPKAPNQPVEIELELLFTNLSRLRLLVFGERIPGTGSLVIRKIRRKDTAGLTTFNLIGLCVLAGLLLWSSISSTVDVYDQQGAAFQKIIIALTGSVLTFVGLSLGRIRSWFAVLTDGPAVARFPEMHLDLSSFRGISSSAWTVVLLLLAGLSGWVAYDNWSEKPMIPSGLQLYDREKEQFVSDQRLYRKHLGEGKSRFAIVCTAEDEQVAGSGPISLGFLRPGSIIEPIMFKIEYLPTIGDEHRTELELSGEDWLSTEGLGSIQSLVKEALCGPAFETEKVLKDGSVAKLQDTGKAMERHLLVTSQRMWQASEILAWLEGFKSSLRGSDFGEVFNRRTEHLQNLTESLEEALGPSGLVPFDEIQTLTMNYLGQIGGVRHQKKAIERSVILRGLWRATVEKRDRPPRQPEIEAVALALQDLLRRDLGWKVERAILEFLFEIQAQNPGNTGRLLHEAAVGPWVALENNQRFPRLCDYLIAGVSLDALGKPQQDFLRHLYSEFKTWAGPEVKLAEFLLKREEKERSDPGINREDVLSRAAMLEAQMLIEFSEVFS